VPIRIDIDLLLVKRKISSKELADAIHITPANLSILKTGKARAIRLDTLAALCRVLDCQPGELLTYIPGDDDEIEFSE
jgi:putative transcriptional regulator